MKENVKYKNKIRGAMGQKSVNRLSDALKDVKKNAPIRDFSTLLNMAMRSANFASAVPSLFKISDAHLIKRRASLGTTPIDRELAWALCLLNNKNDEIINFLNLKAEYENFVILEKYHDAENILNRISNDLGWSTWLVENKIALLSKSKGLEAHKNFVKDITENLSNSFFVFYAKEVSSRNENSIEWSGFSRRYTTRSKKWSIHSDYRKFLRYKILGVPHIKCEDISAILSHEASTSYMGLYETLVELLPVILENPKLSGSIKIFLNDFIQYDSRLEPIIFLRNQNINSGPVNFSGLLLTQTIESAKFSLSIEHGGILKEIFEKLTDLYNFGTDAVESCEMLAKLCGNWRSLPFIQFILFEIHKFSNGIQSVILSPYFRYISIAILKERAEENLMGANEYSILAELDECLLIGDNISALSKSRDLQRSNINYFKNVGILREIKSISLTEGRLKAMSCGIFHGSRNESIIEFIDVPSLMKDYDYSEFKVNTSSVIPSISFCLLDIIEETQYSALHCKTAIKQFLKSYNIGVPSEISIAEITESREELVYFLRYACDIEYLELCRPINSPKAASQERIKICSLLTTIDEENSFIYNSEISDLALKISTEDGMAIVESTRVYVDTQGLIEWSEKELKDIYLSYIAHVKAGIITNPRDIIMRVELAINRTQESDDGNSLLTGDLGADGKMKELMEDFGDAFLRAPKYGLNSFLGTRVRHGSLEGYFRGRFEKRHMIYYFDKPTKKYVVSNYWTTRLCNGDASLERNLGQLISEASKAVDELLADAALNRLQIKSKDFPNGLIEFKTESATVDQVFDRWAAAGKLITNYSNSFRHFARYCIDELFWPGLTISLKDVQNFVINDLKNKLFDIVTEIEDFVDEHCDEQRSRDFRREVQLLREDLTGVAELVANWFQGQGVYEDNMEFSITALRNTAIQAAKYVRPNFNPHFQLFVSDESDKPINLNYGIILDVFLIIFVNISKWSGHEGGTSHSSSKVNVDFHSDVSSDDYLLIKIKSDLHKPISLIDLREKLDKIRENIVSGDYLHRSQSDNGSSGLYRIAAMLSSPADAGLIPLEFFIEDGRFCISFRITRKMLFKKEVFKALEST